MKFKGKLISGRTAPYTKKDGTPMVYIDMYFLDSAQGWENNGWFNQPIVFVQANNLYLNGVYKEGAKPRITYKGNAFPAERIPELKNHTCSGYLGYDSKNHTLYISKLDFE